MRQREMMSIERLDPPSLTQSFVGHIAQIAIAPPASRLAAISGQVALDQNGNLVAPVDHAGQARQCFANIRNALAAIGAGPEQILQMRIHVVGHRPELIGPIFEAGREVFAERWPVTASTWVGVETLAVPEWLVEIEVLVTVPSSP